MSDMIRRYIVNDWKGTVCTPGTSISIGSSRVSIRLPNKMRAKASSVQQKVWKPGILQKISTIMPVAKATNNIGTFPIRVGSISMARI